MVPLIPSVCANLFSQQTKSFLAIQTPLGLHNTSDTDGRSPDLRMITRRQPSRNYPVVLCRPLAVYSCEDSHRIGSGFPLLRTMFPFHFPIRKTIMPHFYLQHNARSSDGMMTGFLFVPLNGLLAIQMERRSRLMRTFCSHNCPVRDMLSLTCFSAHIFYCHTREGGYP